MTGRPVPIWALLPRSAPETHHRAWERAWSRIRPPRGTLSGAPGANVAPLIGEVLLHLVEDPEAPPELVGEAVTAHVTEGRGAPDGVSPRGRLLLGCLRRAFWRPSWLPAALVALQEGDRDLPEEERVDLARRLLTGSRLDERLRPLVMALCLLGRPHRSSEEIERMLRNLLEGADIDPEARERLFELLGRTGWFVVRPESLKDHPEFDESTRTSLRRSRPVQLLISASCVAAVRAVRERPGPVPRRRPRTPSASPAGPGLIPIPVPRPGSPRSGGTPAAVDSREERLAAKEAAAKEAAAEKVAAEKAAAEKAAAEEAAAEKAAAEEAAAEKAAAEKAAAEKAAAEKVAAEEAAAEKAAAEEAAARGTPPSDAAVNQRGKSRKKRRGKRRKGALPQASGGGQARLFDSGGESPRP